MRSSPFVQYDLPSVKSSRSTILMPHDLHNGISSWGMKIISVRLHLGHIISTAFFFSLKVQLLENTIFSNGTRVLSQWGAKVNDSLTH